MKVIILISRVLMGLVFVVFGLNGFFEFLEVPKMSGDAAKFMGALHASGYLYVVKAIEVAGGALLLAGKKQAVALTLLTPVVLNILLFHVFLEPGGLPIAIAVVLLNVLLLWAHRTTFRKVLKAS